jgi:SET domain-containing protein
MENSQNLDSKMNYLLKELNLETYAMIQPSGIHGIGVFAIRDIPKGCRNIFSKNIGEWVKIPITDVENMPEHSKNLIETYCLFDKENYFVPDYGFKVMDLVNYLNHSSQPNIVSLNQGEDFEALIDIQAGEELLINYYQIAEGVESY